MHLQSYRTMPTRRSFSVLSLFLTLGLILLTAGPAAYAQTTIQVTTTVDNENAGDGECTLREAIINANNNTDSTNGDCAAGT